MDWFEKLTGFREDSTKTRKAASKSSVAGFAQRLTDNLTQRPNWKRLPSRSYVSALELP